MKLKVEQILFTEPFKAEFVSTREIDLNTLNDDAVVVKTAVSTISCGTEKANYIGEKRVTADSNKIAPFPRVPGYASCGEVVFVGNAVKNFSVGDRVVISNFLGNHVNYSTVKETDLVKIPDGVSYEDASISFIATFPLAGLRKVKLEVGESCLVMGLGILGQFAVKFARVMGAYPIIAVDPVEERRNMALQNGADFAFDPFDKKTVSKIKEITNGGVNTAIEVTGVGAGLDQTLDCMKKLGRVALLGCTRNSDFTIDYYKKVHSPGITLVGAHTNARPNIESYPHYLTQSDEVRAILDLIKGDRVTLTSVIKETHKPSDCTKVYDRLISDKNFPVGVQFDWRNEDE